LHVTTGLLLRSIAVIKSRWHRLNLSSFGS